VAYGLLLPFVFLGVRAIIDNSPKYSHFLLSWASLFPILISIPFSLQRRLIEGMWMALVALSLVGYECAKRKVWQRAFSITFLLFPTTLFLFAGGFLGAMNPAEPLFKTAPDVAAYQFLADHTDGDAVVLSSYETGNALPAWAPVFVVMGHRPESAGIAEIRPRVIKFFQSDNFNEERLRLLDEFDVDYVFWGPAERELGNWNPAAADYLTEVYNDGDVRIFSITRE